MSKLLIRVFVLVLVVGASAGIYSYLNGSPSRYVDAYIDGNWVVGEFRGCILFPPEREKLYCGVNAKGPWAHVLSEKEHIHVTRVAFHGYQEAVFWRCQNTQHGVACESQNIKTEIVPGPSYAR